MLRLVDLVLIVIIAIIAGLMATLTPDNVGLRMIIGLPFVLIVPGYAITAAAFPKQDLEKPERLLLSLGLSLATIIIGGLLLYLTWGLHTGSWVILLLTVTLVASVIAAVRRERGLDKGPTAFRLSIGVGQLFLFGLAALLTIAAIGLARTPLPLQNVQGYTELWMLPANGNIGNVVRLGVTSMETATTTYSLRVQLDGQVIQEWSDIQLTPGQRWETMFDLPPVSSNRMVEALLYRSDRPGDIYRRVTLWPIR